jgi:small-conductance mechanosensitive channel
MSIGFAFMFIAILSISVIIYSKIHEAIKEKDSVAAVFFFAILCLVISIVLILTGFLISAGGILNIL